MKRMIVSKRASEAIAIPTLAQIILAILFVSVFFLFASQTISGRAVYEEIYAKKIALVLDGALPGTVFQLDISDALSHMKEKGYCGQSSEKNNCFFIDETRKAVVVSLGAGGTPYRYAYFSDYNFKLIKNENILIISVEAKDGPSESGPEVGK